MICSWDVAGNDIVKPPKGTTHVVLDTPAGLHGKRLREVLKRKVSDIYADQTGGRA